MTSVADTLKREIADLVRGLEPERRIELALQLGDDDVRLLCAARGCSEDEARRVFRIARQLGRQPSVANEALA